MERRATWRAWLLILGAMLAGVVLTCAACGGARQVEPRASAPAQSIPATRPEVVFPELFVRARDAFTAAESAYRVGDFQQAADLLDAFWVAHPPGTRQWVHEVDEEREPRAKTGVNYGRPGFYSALRMLTECAHWRLRAAAATPRPAAKTVRLTVVLVGKSSGLSPRSLAEVGRGGEMAHHVLEPGIDETLLDQSLYLFTEYVAAMTEGRLGVEHGVVRLPALDVPVRTVVRVSKAGGRPRRRMSAGLAPEAPSMIWSAIDDATLGATDWWWVIYPSHVPEQSPDFSHSEFVTGGMGAGPSPGSPAFIGDDRWLVRVPPHLGYGPQTEEQRRAYLPQWLQHEFFHHLFGLYPTLGLEASDHQWFDRRTWPADFEGHLEADYYAEALGKRLRSAEPPLFVSLRAAPPAQEVLDRITSDMLLGRYRREPVQNPWHEGKISRNAAGMRWINDAGRSWTLTPDLAHGVMNCGAGNPYHDDDEGRAFSIQLRRSAEGEYVPEVAGFRFNGGFFRRLQ